MNAHAFIEDSEIDRALDFLRDTATAAAQAKANRIYMEEYKNVVKAKVMQEHKEMSVSAQEREAYADPRYAAHLEAIKEAVEADDKFRFLRVAAEAKIEAWRSQQANIRAMKI